MTEFPVRHFLSDDAVAHVGEGLIARTLPREEWTHEAHLAATTYLVLKHPEIDLDAELPGIIRATMRASAAVNTDTKAITTRSPALTCAASACSSRKRTPAVRSTSWSTSC